MFPPVYIRMPLLICYMDRRTVLRTVGAGVTIGLAGCPGSNDSSSVRSENTSTPTNTTGPTETASPTQTPEPKFSTNGNDSSLINKPIQELTLTKNELPSGYSLSSESRNESGEQIRAKLTKAFDKGDNAIRTQTSLFESISTSKSMFDFWSLDKIMGGNIEIQNKESLNIAVESQFESSQIKESYVDFIKFRDANAFSFILWLTLSKREMAKIANLTVKMHQKWR